MTRLQKYLKVNEITEMPKEKVDKILDVGFKEYNKRFKKSILKPWPLLLIYLVSSFECFNISFMIRDYVILRKMFGISKECMGKTLLKKGAPIEIYIKKKDLKKPKLLRKYIYDVLIHELVHREQFKKVDFNRELSNVSSLGKQPFGYYSSKTEIEAFARDAVNELEQNNSSEIIDCYIEYVRFDSKKAWQRFLKKLYQYLGMYGSDKAKKNFNKQMRSRSLIFKLKNLEDAENAEWYGDEEEEE